MNDLADRLNITKPALYHYFKNKEDILVGCYQHGIASIEARLKRAGGTAGSGVEKTRAFVHAYVDAVVSLDFGQCVATLDDAELSPSARAAVRKLKRRIDSTLRHFIEEGIADGTIQPCNSKLASFAIAGAINWIGTWYDPSGALQGKEIVENYTRLLVDGLNTCTGTNAFKKTLAREAKKR